MDGWSEGGLHLRKCPLWHFRKFVKTVGYDEFVGIIKFIIVAKQKNAKWGEGGHTTASTSTSSPSVISLIPISFFWLKLKLSMYPFLSW